MTAISMMTGKSMRALVAALGIFSLAACTSGAGPKEQVGTVMGAAAGAAVGSQIGGGTGRTVAIAVGTLLGGLMGSEIGRSLDRADRAAMAQTTNQALENGRSGEAQEWRNPDSGNYGYVTPQPAYQASSGEYCREYQQEVIVDGKRESAYGTACRQPDGSWKVVNS